MGSCSCLYDGLESVFHHLIALIFWCRPLKLYNNTDFPVAIRGWNETAAAREGYNTKDPARQEQFLLAPGQSIITYLHGFNANLFDFSFFIPQDATLTRSQPRLYCEISLKSTICNTIPDKLVLSLTPTLDVSISSTLIDQKPDPKALLGLYRSKRDLKEIDEHWAGKFWFARATSIKPDATNPDDVTSWTEDTPPSFLGDDSEPESEIENRIPSNPIEIIDLLQTYYSEIILIYLGVQSLIVSNTVGPGLMTLLVALFVMILHGTRSTSERAFHDFYISRPEEDQKEVDDVEKGEKWKTTKTEILQITGSYFQFIQNSVVDNLIRWKLNLKEPEEKPKLVQEVEYRPIENIDCLPDTGVYVIPMILNALAVLLLDGPLSSPPLTVTSLFTSSIAFGYCLFAATIIHLLLYKHIRVSFRKLGFFLSFFLAGSAPWASMAFILYFAFYPFHGQPYVVGAAVVIILGPILGLKGILIPYAFNNLESLGIIVFLFNFCFQYVSKMWTYLSEIGLNGIVLFWSQLFSEFFPKMRDFTLKSGLVVLLVFQFFLGIAIILILANFLVKGNVSNE